MGNRGEKKNFFSREKKPKRRLRYIFVSSLSTVALCEGGSSFQKKRRILMWVFNLSAEVRKYP